MPDSKKDNKSIYLMIVILGQTLLVLVISIYLYLWINGIEINKIVQSKTITSFFMTCGITLSVVAIILLKQVLYLSVKEKEAEVTKVRLEDSKNIVDALRTQRHDFVNHLQVVSGLAQLGQPEKVVDYVKQVSSELNISGKVIYLAKPEVAAILLTKVEQAQAKKIKALCFVKTSLDKLHIPATDLTSILGNLIDNAIFALEGVNSGEKELTINLREKENNYVFEIYNSLPIIPEDIQPHIFEKGFSTREGEGHGYGLYIVKDLTEKNGGQVYLRSKENEGTTFTVALPI